MLDACEAGDIERVRQCIEEEIDEKWKVQWIHQCFFLFQENKAFTIIRKALLYKLLLIMDSLLLLNTWSNLVLTSI